MLAWITTELKRQEDQLGKSEEDLTTYRESRNALSLEDRQNIVVQRLNTLNDSVTRARTVRLSKETVYNQLKGANPSDDSIDAFPIVGANPGWSRRGTSCSPRRAEKASLVSRNFGPEWPAMKTAEAAIAAARRQLVAERTNVIESVRNEYNAALAEERNLSGSLEEAKGASIDLDRKSGDYRILQRKARQRSPGVQSLLAQQKELRVVANSRANNVQVMERAEVPGAPISPNPRRDWITAILAGLDGRASASRSASSIWTTRSRRPKTSRGGSSCRCSAWCRRSAAGASRSCTGAVPHDFGEAFRSLRTSLVFTSGGERRGSSR